MFVATKKPRKPLKKISDKKLAQNGGRMPRSSVTPKLGAKPKRKAGAMGALMQRVSKPKARKPVKRVNAKRRAKNFQRAYGGEERVEWVKSLPCFAAELSPCEGAIENAHTENGGKGRKADADTIVPACHKHHADFDQHRAPFDIASVRRKVRELSKDVEAAWQARQLRTAA